MSHSQNKESYEIVHGSYFIFISRQQLFIFSYTNAITATNYAFENCVKMYGRKLYGRKCYLFNFL